MREWSGRQGHPDERTRGGLNLKVDSVMGDGDQVALFGTSDAVTLKGRKYSRWPR